VTFFRKNGTKIPEGGESSESWQTSLVELKMTPLKPPENRGIPINVSYIYTNILLAHADFIIQSTHPARSRKTPGSSRENQWEKPHPW